MPVAIVLRAGSIHVVSPRGAIADAGPGFSPMEVICVVPCRRHPFSIILGSTSQWCPSKMDLVLLPREGTPLL